MLRLIIVLVLTTTVSGCGGLAVGTYGKKELARSDFALAKERNKFALSKRTTPYTKSEIIENWGEADEIQAYKNCEVLVFKNGTSWAGGGAVVGVVPVPVMVPSGTYKNRFYLRNGAAVGVVEEYGEADRAVGYTCGSNECKASTGEKVNEPRVNAGAAIEGWCQAPL